MVDSGLDLTTAVMVVLTAAVTGGQYVCLKREKPMVCGGSIVGRGGVCNQVWGVISVEVKVWIEVA